MRDVSKRIDIGNGRVWAMTRWGWLDMPHDATEEMVDANEVDGGTRYLEDAEVARAEMGLGPLRAQSVTVRDASGEVIYQEPDAASAIGTMYTHAQLAAAVDEAHAALREALEDSKRGRYNGMRRCVERASEALHRVGAGMPRVSAKKGV